MDSTRSARPRSPPISRSRPTSRPNSPRSKPPVGAADSLSNRLSSMRRRPDSPRSTRRRRSSGRSPTASPTSAAAPRRRWRGFTAWRPSVPTIRSSRSARTSSAPARCLRRSACRCRRRELRATDNSWWRRRPLPKDTSSSPTGWAPRSASGPIRAAAMPTTPWRSAGGCGPPIETTSWCSPMLPVAMRERAFWR